MVVLPSGRTEIFVRPATLAKYLGTYQIRPEFSIVISQEGNHLMAKATDQAQIRLFAESGTKFFFKAIDGEIEFFGTPFRVATPHPFLLYF
jgi:hypothetical protein